MRRHLPWNFESTNPSSGWARPEVAPQPKGIMHVKVDGRIESIRFQTLKSAREATRLVGFPAYAERRA